MAYKFSDDEVRMLSVAAPVILRMLQSREKSIADRIYGEFRNGKTDHTSSIAELCCIRDQQNEIRNVLKLNDKGV